MNRNHQYCPSSSPEAPGTHHIPNSWNSSKNISLGPDTDAQQRGAFAHTTTEIMRSLDHGQRGVHARCVPADYAQLEDLPLWAWVVALVFPPMKLFSETSLIVQWLRICLSTQETCVQSLVRELRSHMPHATKHTCPSYREARCQQWRADMLQLRPDTLKQTHHKWIRKTNRKRLLSHPGFL